jgi:8-oxo-dGTP pyrophosphatase MutT (NUDIX family)
MEQGVQRPLRWRPLVTNIVSCGAIVLCKTSRRSLFLLRNVKQSGTWGLPGGKLNDNELPLAGLLREIKEETQVDLSSNKIIPIETFTSENAKFVYHTFLILVDEEFLPVLNEEHRGYCWVHTEDYPKPLHSGVFRTFKISAILDKLKTIEHVLDNKKGAL